MTNQEAPECDTPDVCDFQDVTREMTKVINQTTKADGVEQTVDKWKKKIRKCLTCGRIAPDKPLVEG